MSDSIQWLYPLLIAFGGAVLLYGMASVPLTLLPKGGHRGAERQRARRSIGFRMIEVPMRIASAHIERLGFSSSIAQAESRLRHAGDYLGITGSELLGLRVVGFFYGLAAAAVIAQRGFGPAFCGAVVVLGVILAEQSVRSARRKRETSIDRALPNCIDLAAMCMGAGLDFPGALTQVVENLDARCSMRVELEHILHELALGHTRRDALLNLSERVPTDAVKEFVTSCVQAEEKGTPLVSVLRVQATALRGRRSVRAEEAAARAGTLMMLPLMMLFGCVLIVVLGPLILEMKGGM